MRCTSGFEKERMALILVDIQRKFSESTDGIRKSSSERMVTVNQAISRFHSAGNPVVYVRYTGEMYDGRPVAEGMDSFDPSLLPPEEGDPIVCKTEMNAFKGSDLESVLKLGVRLSPHRGDGSPLLRRGDLLRRLRQGLLRLPPETRHFRQRSGERGGRREDLQDDRRVGPRIERESRAVFFLRIFPAILGSSGIPWTRMSTNSPSRP